jgi:saccharopine dehydrogenase-like NADP-dependent oxidoreductase
VAQHLLHKCPDMELTLTGRSLDKCRAALLELSDTYPTRNLSRHVKAIQVRDAWSVVSNTPDDDEWRKSLQQADVVIHTAGPYAGKGPTLLEALLQMKVDSENSTRCKVYVDVSDPLTYLDAAVQLDSSARARGLTAMVAAGAFPGMSNVLAMEAASFSPQVSEAPCKVRDLYFQYFTAGLGGSGEVNLYITNLGFGDDMSQFHEGKLQRYQDLSGRLLGAVDFGPHVGSKRVFSWPFPEAATVASELNITGMSLAAMSTAPDLWNTLLDILVKLVPRAWWRVQAFSKFIADFSRPLVHLSDQYLKWVGLGETHAMRIDVSFDSSQSVSGSADDHMPAVSLLQSHKSFQQCVGQSAAEFALDCLIHPDPGVYLPEYRYRDSAARRRIIPALTSTPGTTHYSGPISVASSETLGPSKRTAVLPSNVRQSS